LLKKIRVRNQKMKTQFIDEYNFLLEDKKLERDHLYLTLELHNAEHTKRQLYVNQDTDVIGEHTKR
jgi:hypothetical protein